MFHNLQQKDIEKFKDIFKKFYWIECSEDIINKSESLVHIKRNMLFPNLSKWKK